LVDVIEIMFDLTVRCTFNNPLCSFYKCIAALPLVDLTPSKEVLSENLSCPSPQERGAGASHHYFYCFVLMFYQGKLQRPHEFVPLCGEGARFNIVQHVLRWGEVYSTGFFFFC